LKKKKEKTYTGHSDVTTTRGAWGLHINTGKGEGKTHPKERKLVEIEAARKVREWERRKARVKEKISDPTTDTYLTGTRHTAGQGAALANRGAEVEAT
jgi:hypothetical protein